MQTKTSFELKDKEMSQTAKSLIDMIGSNDEFFSLLSSDLGVDNYVKKLPAKELFQVCLFSILTERDSSSRVFSNFYDNYFFRHFAEIPSTKRLSHSSIAERIRQISPDYFKRIYAFVVDKFQELLGGKAQKLCIYDSTTLSISSKLLGFGMTNGRNKKEQDNNTKKSIKLTIGFNELIPNNVIFHKEQSEVGDNLAISKALLRHINKDDILVFDAGVQKRETFAKMSQRNFNIKNLKKGSKKKKIK